MLKGLASWKRNKRLSYKVPNINNEVTVLGEDSVWGLRQGVGGVRRRQRVMDCRQERCEGRELKVIYREHVCEGGWSGVLGRNGQHSHGREGDRGHEVCPTGEEETRGGQ